MSEKERLLKADAYLACAVQELNDDQTAPWANRTLVIADIEIIRKAISARMRLIDGRIGDGEG